MPRRPPKAWWNACVTGVVEKGGRRARDPRAVCGAVWARKPQREKEHITMASERTKRRGKKRHKAHHAAAPTHHHTQPKVAQHPRAGQSVHHRRRRTHAGQGRELRHLAELLHQMAETSTHHHPKQHGGHAPPPRPRRHSGGPSGAAHHRRRHTHAKNEHKTRRAAHHHHHHRKPEGLLLTNDLSPRGLDRLRLARKLGLKVR